MTIAKGPNRPDELIQSLVDASIEIGGGLLTRFEKGEYDEDIALDVSGVGRSTLLALRQAMVCFDQFVREMTEFVPIERVTQDQCRATINLALGDILDTAPEELEQNPPSHLHPTYKIVLDWRSLMLKRLTPFFVAAVSE